MLRLLMPCWEYLVWWMPGIFMYFQHFFVNRYTFAVERFPPCHWTPVFGVPFIKMSRLWLPTVNQGLNDVAPMYCGWFVSISSHSNPSGPLRVLSWERFSTGRMGPYFSIIRSSSDRTIAGHFPDVFTKYLFLKLGRIGGSQLFAQVFCHSWPWLKRVWSKGAFSILTG